LGIGEQQLKAIREVSQYRPNTFGGLVLWLISQRKKPCVELV
jgi:hypothetical protein